MDITSENNCVTNPDEKGKTLEDGRLPNSITYGSSTITDDKTHDGIRIKAVQDTNELHVSETPSCKTNLPEIKSRHMKMGGGELSKMTQTSQKDMLDGHVDGSGVNNVKDTLDHAKAQNDKFTENDSDCLGENTSCNEHPEGMTGCIIKASAEPQITEACKTTNKDQSKSALPKAAHIQSDENLPKCSSNVGICKIDSAYIKKDNVHSDTNELDNVHLLTDIRMYNGKQDTFQVGDTSGFETERLSHVTKPAGKIDEEQPDENDVVGTQRGVNQKKESAAENKDINTIVVEKLSQPTENDQQAEYFNKPHSSSSEQQGEHSKLDTESHTKADQEHTTSVCEYLDTDNNYAQQKEMTTRLAPSDKHIKKEKEMHVVQSQAGSDVDLQVECRKQEEKEIDDDIKISEKRCENLLLELTKDTGVLETKLSPKLKEHFIDKADGENGAKKCERNNMSPEAVVDTLTNVNTSIAHQSSEGIQHELNVTSEHFVEGTKSIFQTATLSKKEVNCGKLETSDSSNGRISIQNENELKLNNENSKPIGDQSSVPEDTESNSYETKVEISSREVTHNPKMTVPGQHHKEKDVADASSPERGVKYKKKSLGENKNINVLINTIVVEKTSQSSENDQQVEYLNKRHRSSSEQQGEHTCSRLDTESHTKADQENTTSVCEYLDTDNHFIQQMEMTNRLAPSDKHIKKEKAMHVDLSQAGSDVDLQVECRNQKEKDINDDIKFSEKRYENLLSELTKDTGVLETTLSPKLKESFIDKADGSYGVIKHEISKEALDVTPEVVEDTLPNVNISIAHQSSQGIQHELNVTSKHFEEGTKSFLQTATLSTKEENCGKLKTSKSSNGKISIQNGLKFNNENSNPTEDQSSVPEDTELKSYETTVEKSSREVTHNPEMTVVDTPLAVKSSALAGKTEELTNSLQDAKGRIDTLEENQAILRRELSDVISLLRTVATKQDEGINRVIDQNKLILDVILSMETTLLQSFAGTNSKVTSLLAREGLYTCTSSTESTSFLSKLQNVFMKDHGTGASGNTFNHPSITPKDKFHLCLAGRNHTYLTEVTREIKNIVLQKVKNIKITSLEIYQNPKSACDRENFNGASMIIFVAVSEPRMVFISDKEESQLGNVYKRAKHLALPTFLILAGHQQSENLKNTALCADILQELFPSQPDIADLYRQNQFISVGYVFNPAQLQFNQAQQDALLEWITKSLPS